MSEKKKKELDSTKLGQFIIATSVVWGAVMIGVSIILKDTGCGSRVLPLLGSGAAVCVIFLPMMLLKNRKGNSGDNRDSG